MLTAEQLELLARCALTQADQVGRTGLGPDVRTLAVISEARVAAQAALTLAGLLRDDRAGFVGVDTVNPDAAGYAAGASWGDGGPEVECGGESPYAAVCDALASVVPSIDPTAGV